MEFSRAIEKFKKEMDEEVLAGVNEVIDTVYTYLVDNAAVDTGAFKANMNVSMGVPDTSFEPNVDKAGHMPPPKMTMPYHKYFISNGAPYGWRLEYGWSDKQPYALFHRAAGLANAKYRYVKQT